MYVCNKETYGYFPVPMRTHATLQDEADSFLHTHLEVMGECASKPSSICLCATDLQAVYVAINDDLNKVFAGIAFKAAHVMCMKQQRKPCQQHVSLKLGKAEVSRTKSAIDKAPG